MGASASAFFLPAKGLLQVRRVGKTPLEETKMKGRGQRRATAHPPRENNANAALWVGLRATGGLPGATDGKDETRLTS